MRVFIIMLDSFGLGATSDAADYGDTGAYTLGHIAEYCLAAKADKQDVRKGPLFLPNLTRLGLNAAALLSQGSEIPGLTFPGAIQSLYGCAEEISLGKDTQSGHWEMAGVPVLFKWGYFCEPLQCFPENLLDELILQAHLPGVLGNKHASGTDIIVELGSEHQKTGKPIVYTSADSVFQIAAHEESFGLERLYQLCEITRRLVDSYNIGRVIARPFLGVPGQYYRTGNRRDYATPPPAKTVLDSLIEAGGEVIAIGKVADIYGHQGISKIVKAHGNKALFAAFLQEANVAPARSITFVNLVDFDMLFGHRRDVIGYAKALEDFDSWLPTLEKQLKPNDLVIITADHGCDPTWRGSDHTRENVPILVFGPNVRPGSMGKRQSFADIGQSIAKYLNLPKLAYGTTFL